MQNRTIASILPLFTVIAALGVSSTAEAAPGEVLILDSTVSGGSMSVEAQRVAELGYTPVLVDNLTWSGMSTADFSDYEAIVLGDPTCGNIMAIAAAEANAATWAAAVDGNVMVVGTDPTYHFNARPGAAMLNDNELAFVLADAGTGMTGALVSMSCYYHASGSVMVEVLSGFGDFTVRGAGATGGLENVHIVASHPSLLGLTDALLSNWGNSVHEHFLTWPGDFEVLALAVLEPGTYVSGDGTTGYPYLLARGVIPDLCGDGMLDPGEECDDGNNLDGDGCDAACNVEICPDADGDTVCDDDDVCPGGDDDEDDDGDGVPDFCDICPGGDDSIDSDLDDVPDFCDECPEDPDNDADGDGVCGDVDLCADTLLPEGVPTVSLGVNRFADIDGDGVFETEPPKGGGNGPGYSYTLEDTAGCSCEQIIEALQLGLGHTKFGCSISAMNDWLDVVAGAQPLVSDGGPSLQLTPSLDDELAQGQVSGGCSLGGTKDSPRWALLGLLGLLGVGIGRRRRS